jgi:hypothetical protein
LSESMYILLDVGTDGDNKVWSHYEGF